MARSRTQHSLSPAAVVATFFLCAAFAFASYLHDGSPRRAIQSIHPLGPTLLTTVPDIAYQSAPQSAPAQVPFPSHTYLPVRVVRVADGDTLTVTRTGLPHSITVRLAAIDAPESGQPYGEASRQALLRLLQPNPSGLTLYIRERDRYGRAVGWLFREQVCLNLEMVAQGHAWHFTRYDQDPAYARAQARAQASRLGLWQDPNPVPPWLWRKQLSSVSPSLRE